MEVDDLVLDVIDVKSSGKKARPATVPAKHGAVESRVALSPVKINELFKASKAAAATAAIVEGKPTPPLTPRHRDAAARKVPITPRHRVGIVGKPLTPRTPHTPATPRTSALTVYNEARQIFTRSTNPGRIFGRETERQELETFVSSRLEKKKSGCLYISGPPGTGKSALVASVVGEFEESKSVKTAYLNCMSVKAPKDIYAKLMEDFGISDDCKEGEEAKRLQQLFKSREHTYLVTLDEIDHLLEVDMEIMYTVFEWSLQPRTSLILFGIANALDFTDRFLPRLKSRGLKPELLPFMPYSAPQISSVITSKLKALMPENATSTPDYVPFIHPAAILFLSKKVAAQSGDLRKAFDICRRAIDLIENETRAQLTKEVNELTPTSSPSPSKTPLVENMNLSSPATRTPKKISPPKNMLTSLRVETAPRATIAHMSRITAAIFSNGTNARLASLNLQQKAVLCSLSALEERNKQAMANGTTSSSLTAPTPSKKDHAAPTIKTLYETYTALCRRENVLHPLTSTEFRDVIGSLETLSLLAGIEGKGGSLAVQSTPSRRGRGGFATTSSEEKRVASVVSKKELEGALTGVGADILKEILEGQGL